jgi:microcystin-dependent protein
VANFVTPEKTASRPFSAGGVYFGTVTRVDDSLKRVYVKIPRFVTNAEFGPLAVVGPDLPVVGDRVACLFMENRTDDIVVIGVVKNQSMLPTAPVVVATSTTHPDFPKVGTILYETDTEDIYVWSGTEWLTFFEVNLPATIYADLQGTAASATFAVTAASATFASTAASATIASSVADNSVVLGDDTTGNYVATVTAGTGVSISAGAGTGEGSTPTLAIGQSVDTTATPSFSSITSTVATGTSPLTVASTTLVSNLNADLLDGQHASFYMPSGSIQQYAGLSAPTGWLFCDGSSISRTTYADLFSAVTLSKGTVTMTIATPCVVTLSSHGLVAGDAVYLTTTGALATGLTADNTYYIQNPATNTFNLNTSQANAIANSATGRVATSGSQSGTHTLVRAPWAGITASNFTIPDLRGRIGVGIDNMGGSDASRLSVNNAVGLGGGAETHTLSTAEMPPHTHTAGLYDALGINNNLVTDGGGGNAYQALIASGLSATTRVTTNSTGGSGGVTSAHNNMQPYILLNYIIKT